MRYGFYLVFTQRPDEGYKELQTAEFLDAPLPKIKKNLGHVFYVKRQFTNAIEQYKKAFEMVPNYVVSHLPMGDAYRALGNYTNAIDEYQNYDIAVGKDPAQVQMHFDQLRRAYADGGARGYWVKCLREAEEAGDVYSQAQCYAELDNYDQALALLKQVYANHKQSPGGVPNALFYDECWDNVRTNPRFIDVLKTIGFKK